MGRDRLPSICSSIAGTGTLAGALVLTLAGGCTVRTGSTLLPQPRGQWVSPLARDHPLVGSIHDVVKGRTIATGELVDALAAADVVILGEQHDNVDHHELQAHLLEQVISAGRRPSVVFEQLDVDKQPAVDAALESHAHEPARVRASVLADAVEWKGSGWPPFDDYRPLFEAAIGARLEIRAANVSRAELRRSFGHPGSMSPDAGAKPAATLSAEARASLAADIEKSHCGYATPGMVDAMIEMQRLRDETMARVVVEALGAATSKSAVLVAGFGHARKDYGVPVYLHRLVPGRRVASVALVEVVSDLATPSAYAQPLHAARLPFDFVIFTPRADDEDPCEKFREGLEKMKSR